MHDAPSIAKGFTPPSYRAVLRDFANGEAEMLVTLIKERPSIHALRDRDAAAAGIPCLPRVAKEPPPKAGDDDASAADNIERSARRARQAVRWRIKGQALDHLLTLTVRDNVQDLGEIKSAWYRFVRMVKAKSGGADWPYVATMERQQRGAWHIHCAVKGRQDVNKLRGLWWKALGAVVKWHRGRPEALGAESPGNIDVQGPAAGRRSWRSRSLAGYLSKYITKDAALVPKGARRYWAPDGFVCPKSVMMLASHTLYDVLLEASEIFEGVAGRFVSPWRSPDWGCIWLST
jgi:hypothetical protein